jgi:TRAP-type mannitol/chloroaromatic compound transport system substrate-binding protein
MNMKKSSGISRKKFIGTGVAGAAMAGSGVASARPPDVPQGPPSHVPKGSPIDMYGALGTGLLDLTEEADFDAFNQMLKEMTGLKFKYKGTWDEGASGKTLFQAVGDGDVKIGESIAYFTKEAALANLGQIYWGLPFGMEAKDFISWLYEEHTPSEDIDPGTVGEMWSGVDIQKHFWAEFNVVPLPFKITPGESGGWFPEEIPDDVGEFETWGDAEGPTWGYTDGEGNYSRTPGGDIDIPHGFQMRLFGLGGGVLKHAFPTFGTPSPTAGDPGLGDLKSSKYNAVEFYLPRTDYPKYVDVPHPNIIDFDPGAKHYYIDCWWDSYSFSNLWINKDFYDRLPEPIKKGLDRATRINMINNLAKVISGQGYWIDQIDAAGATIHPNWPASIITHLKEAAIEWYNILAYGDPDYPSGPIPADPRFEKVLRSMKNFILNTRWPRVPRDEKFGFNETDWNALL